MAEKYLDDGLYASFDGYQIKLRAPRECGDHEVYLDPYALDELMKFIEEIYRTKEADDHK